MRELNYAQKIVRKLIFARSGTFQKSAKLSGDLALGRTEKNEGRKIMTEFLIALLALYAVWSAHKIMRLSAALHILVRLMGAMLEEEPPDLTSNADRLY